MFTPYFVDDEVLFPPRLGDLVPKGSRARLISDVVNQLNLKPIYDTYCNENGGRPAYNPVGFLKAVLYGYMNNIFSLRRLEDAMALNVEYMWLAGSMRPDYSTISRFKTRCMPFIKYLFRQLVEKLASLGYVELSKDLYIDGTTIRSKASRYRIKWRSSAEKYSEIADEAIQEAVEDLLKQVEEGAAEDNARTEGEVHYTPEDARKIAQGIELQPQEDKKKARRIKSKVKSIYDACDRKEKHDRTIAECNGKCGTSPTDPECGIMHAKEDGYDGPATPNYNIQAATQNQFVTNYGAYDICDDKTVSLEFLDTCIEENGVKPGAVVEDAGYGCEEVYVGLAEREIEAVVKYPSYDAQSRQRPVKEGKYDKYGFRLTPDKNGLQCPAGHTLRLLRTEESFSRSGFRSDISHFACDHCQECPFINQCALQKNKSKTISRKLGNLREEEKAKVVLDQPHNHEKLKRRSLEPEPVFGQLKYNHGYTRFRHFGKSKVEMDLGFMFMALNVRKLYKMTKKSV